jgi:PadR family transcriptional regulator PadR
MTRNRRPSPQTAAVLRALAATPDAWRYGYELGQEVALKAGSLYPILMRLTDNGLLEAAWEAEPPQGRPPRHLYRLTPTGLAFTEALPQPAAAERPAPRTELRGAW